MYLYIYINHTGDEPQKQDKQANKRTPLLREEVPYQITLIGLRQRQGSLDRQAQWLYKWGCRLLLMILITPSDV